MTMRRMTALVALAAAATIVLLLPLLSMTASAQAVDRDTACGAPASGYRSDGSKAPPIVTLDAAAAAGLRVGPDGYWRWCDVPAKAEPTSPAPCLAEPVLRSWGPAGACVGQRDRPIPHGGADVWLQQDGAMRGQLVEACTDGRRRVVLETCAPAVECDNEAKATRGGVDYIYDARPKSRRVALGATVQAVAADGSTWPMTCVAGSWQVPETKPVAKPAVVAPPKQTGCGSQTFAARNGLQPLAWWRYEGPRVAVGGIVQLQSLDGGGVPGFGECQATGRLVVK